jgi:hypothetical protein
VTIPERQDLLDALTRRYLTDPEPERIYSNRAAPLKHNGSTVATLPMSDEEVIAYCRRAKNAERFASLFDDGDTSAYEGDDSRADQALVSKLAFYTQDPEQLDRLFRQSALSRPKWERRADYRRRTIKKALSALHEVYSPSLSLRSYCKEDGDAKSGAKQGAKPQDEQAKPSAVPLFRSAKAIAEDVPEEVPWICRPWVARKAISEVVGPIKRSGKTTWVTHMCRKILDGEPFMGEPTERTKVVYLTEQSPTSFAEALQRADLLNREDFIVLEWHNVVGMKWPDVVRAATKKALEISAGILIIDTLTQFAGLKNDAENHAGTAHAVMEPLQEAAGKGLAVVVIRHERKGGGDVGESGRGSSAFGGVVDTIITLRLGEGESPPTVRKIESLSRFSEVPNTLMIKLEGGEYCALGSESAVKTAETRNKLLDAAPTSGATAVSMDVLFESAGVVRSTGYAALKDLVNQGDMVRSGKGRKGSPYRYYRPEPPDLPNKDSFTRPDPVVEVVNESASQPLDVTSHPDGKSFTTPTLKGRIENESEVTYLEHDDEHPLTVENVERLFAFPSYYGHDAAKARKRYLEAEGDEERFEELCRAVMMATGRNPEGWQEHTSEILRAAVSGEKVES